MISFEDFAKLDMRIGTILAVAPVPDTDKLLHLSVDCGEAQPRSIVSGIKQFFTDHTDLVGMQAVFLVNLEPRTIKGIESQGMILAVTNTDEFSLLTPAQKIAPGSRVQ